MNSDTLTTLAVSYAWSMAQVTLFATAALATYAFVRRQSANQNAKLLAAGLAIVALLTVSFLSPWPAWRLADQLGDWSVYSPSRVFRVSHYVEQTTAPFPLTKDAPPALEEETKSEIVPVLVLTDATSDRPTTRAAQLDWLQLSLAAVALLSSLGLARFACGLWAIHRYRKASQPIGDPQLLNEFASLVQQLPIVRSVELREAPTLAVPATIGWRRPLVLIPPGYRNWSAAERRAVLAHELAHVAEHHFPLWLVGQFAVAANFYHPLVHWLVRRLRLEQELAADARALQAFPDRHAYAHILANLALAPARTTAASASLGLYMSRPLLLRRIAMLRQSHASRRHSRFANPVAALLLVLASVLAIGLREPNAAAASDDRPNDQPISNPPTSSAASVIPNVDAASTNSQDPGEPQMVTALFQVSRHPANVLSTDGRTTSDKEWEVFCRTQLALVKSRFVLEAALRDPKVKDLPLIKSQPNPLDLFDGYLHVGFVNDSEIMYISMSCSSPNDEEQRRVIVDAVANAYLDEAVFEADQRHLVARDALFSSYAELNKEIAEKTEHQFALARELGDAGQDGRSRILQELDVKRLDRIETELLRLEDEQLSASTYADEIGGDIQPKDSAKLKYYEQRIAQLEKRRSELEDRVTGRNGGSVELEVMSEEITQLKAIAREMKLRLETMDVEAVVPNRIRQIQKAM